MSFTVVDGNKPKIEYILEEINDGLFFQLIDLDKRFHFIDEFNIQSHSFQQGDDHIFIYTGKETDVRVAETKKPDDYDDSFPSNIIVDIHLNQDDIEPVRLKFLRHTMQEAILYKVKNLIDKGLNDLGKNIHQYGITQPREPKPKRVF